MFAYAGLAALIAGSALVRADPVPTAPGPGDVFKVGGQCSFTWTPDTTGVWKEMNVELMSGSNLQMNHITTIATLDGTDTSTTSHTFDCPDVTPNSAIYFYQFSSPANVSAITWTTRFTIAAADGSTTDPADATQPDGSAIPWGTGALVDPSTAVAAPSYLAGAASGTTATATTGASATAATAATTSSANTAAASSAASTKSGFSTAPAAPSTTLGAAASNSSNSGNSSAAADNGALSAFGVDSYVARAGIALGVAAFTFAVAL
ncbi:hypothetical protein L226DRAFT_108328 [Lentinus tigrinus ALCF2SS1-7]|uniref:Yeast cell wall synthesis Kre9/Knh1-like N-terminal domain-containing protein n=1 Tax=Lentinus tigrinus ALCF2SS1-6 TaxID=1328759 RepID=A0A5C2S5E1_9APHY|nr:hypothetical protein L227DRAFT_564419 [Lentinus tigrinus ALCF2SS1-6]RPD73344.1 hypothetical protein L226DRAFT_108328 [Lentinus tigrinus ALCF2SS1-7]